MNRKLVTESAARDKCTHYWIIDSNNVGHCIYCPEVRDFGKLQRKEEHVEKVERVRARRAPHRRGRPPKYA